VNELLIATQVLQCQTLISCQISAFQQLVEITPCQDQCIEDLINECSTYFPAIADYKALAANVHQLQKNHLNDFRVVIKAFQIISDSLEINCFKRFTPNLIRAARNSTYALLLWLSLRAGNDGFRVLSTILEQISDVPDTLIPHNTHFGEVRQLLAIFCEDVNNLANIIDVVTAHEIVMNANVIDELITNGFVRHRFNIWIVDAFLKTKGLHVSFILLKSVYRDGLRDCLDFASCSVIMEDLLKEKRMEFEEKRNVAVNALDNLLCVRREIVDQVIMNENKLVSQVRASAAMRTMFRCLKMGLNPITRLMENLHLRNNNCQSREPWNYQLMNQVNAGQMVYDIEEIEEAIFW